MSNTKLVFGLLVVAFIAQTVGCGDGRPKRVQVSGKITIDGSPVKLGNIQFIRKSGGRPASAKIQPDGSYRLRTYESEDGCVPGDYLVSISSIEYINDETLRWFLPKKYSVPNTSGLERTVTEATNSMDFTLTWGDDDGPFIEYIE